MLLFKIKQMSLLIKMTTILSFWLFTGEMLNCRHMTQKGIVRLKQLTEDIYLSIPIHPHL